MECVRVVDLELASGWESSQVTAQQVLEHSRAQANREASAQVNQQVIEYMMKEGRK